MKEKSICHDLQETFRSEYDEENVLQTLLRTHNIETNEAVGTTTLAQVFAVCGAFLVLF